MFDFKYPDADFDLMKVGDDELFFALRGEVANVIKMIPGLENVEIGDLVLDQENVSRRRSYGKDMNMYPYIVLPIMVKDDLVWQEFYLILNSFEAGLLKREREPKMIFGKGLTKTFAEFMVSRFPGSNYIEKRSNYFNMAKTIDRIREGELFR